MVIWSSHVPLWVHVWLRLSLSFISHTCVSHILGTLLRYFYSIIEVIIYSLMVLCFNLFHLLDTWYDFLTVGSNLRTIGFKQQVKHHAIWLIISHWHSYQELHSISCGCHSSIMNDDIPQSFIMNVLHSHLGKLNVVANHLCYHQYDGTIYSMLAPFLFHRTTSHAVHVHLSKML